ncbi:MAG: hypothetical protein M1837_006130 [Sclerophora amabilis]|nr:MAG: hypothetical protein M1837_006130 [Sclerophora amabilis]
MSRVKWEPKTEYEYLQNLKILQNCFTKHQIDRPVPVQQLAKCKMQDNLEFLQWTKRYWDNTYGGGDYDAPARRQKVGAPIAAAPSTTHSSRNSAPKRGTTPTTARSSKPRPTMMSGKEEALAEENAGMKEAMANLERERDFYFSKLRDIELLVQQAVDLDPEIEKDEEGLVKNIQAILYSTEEGFEVPNEEEEDTSAVHDDLETF